MAKYLSAFNSSSLRSAAVDRIKDWGYLRRGATFLMGLVGFEEAYLDGAPLGYGWVLTVETTEEFAHADTKKYITAAEGMILLDEDMEIEY